MRHQHTQTYILGLSLLLAACAGPSPAEPESTSAPGAKAPAPAAKTAAPAATSKAAPEPEADPLAHRDDLPPEERVVVFVDGEERVVSEAAALAAGMTLVDFRNEWSPFLFEPMHGPDGTLMPNRYRRIFLGLANDRTDEDGRPLPKHERNFLEVFGIPPSMGVLRDRFLTDADSECLKGVDFALIASLDSLTYRREHKERRHRYKLQGILKKLKPLAKKHALDLKRIEDLDALRPHAPDYLDSIAYLHRHLLEKAVLREIEERLACDGHMHKRYRHKKGKLDHGLRLAVKRFQRKNMLYEHTNIRKETIKRFGTPALQTNHMSLTRALRERVVDAAHIIEDGTTGEQTYIGSDGKEHVVRNLVDEFRDALLKQTGLDTPEGALAFFRRHPAEDFEWMRVGVVMPKLPEYYADHMALDIEVTRGDVWYDIPFNDEGKKIRQPRRRMPKLSLFVTWKDQRIRLVRWPTTIGGWRKDLAGNGYNYLRYKGSDVGDRVIRKIIAGPTWVPPESTPLKSMAKRSYVNGGRQAIVNYAEMGPGYLSAYGLVAGYFVIPGRDGRPDQDRGIRAHGSSDFMSIRSAQRFSHGCHRLLNHSAVRLYGYILNHRRMVVAGDQPISHQRQFLYGDVVHHVRLPSRGFQYTLDPPLPVSVKKGRVMGDTRRPYEGYVKIPGEAYPDSMPGEPGSGGESRAGTDGDDDV